MTIDMTNNRVPYGLLTDDLVKRLRDAVNGEHDMTPHGADCLQAADRIEELKAKLAKVVELLIVCRDMFDEVAHPSDPLSKMLNDALAEIESSEAVTLGEKT
jgi:hypothetical protein